MKDTQRIEALREDVVDYQNMKGLAEDVRDQGAVDTYQELIDEDKHFIDVLLGVENTMVPA